MDNRLMMETEEEASDVFEGESQEEVMIESQEEDIMESEEEDIMESEEEDIMESEEEDEEEAEHLEEMKPPVVTSWIGPDGITVHGVICIDDGVIRLKNRCQLDDCSICYKPSTTHGKHQICSLPCGHMYGFSCIKKWLLLSSSAGKCPQCKALCSFEDAKLLYPTRLCVTTHQKASSAAFFPFTEQGFLEFKEYEYSRICDASDLRAADVKHGHILVTKHNDLTYRMNRLTRRRVKLLTRAKELEERAECLGLADALRRRAAPLEARVKALRRRTDALERLFSALTRRIGALEQRYDAYESRLIFYYKMYKEHCKSEEELAKAKHSFERKDSLAEMAAPKAKNKGEKEAEKVAKKKLKDKEKKDEKKMQASGTVDVPEDEMVEDVAEEPEKEKVEVKEKPTTKTKERVRVRSRSGVLTQSRR